MTTPNTYVMTSSETELKKSVVTAHSRLKLLQSKSKEIEEFHEEVIDSLKLLALLSEKLNNSRKTFLPQDRNSLRLIMKDCEKMLAQFSNS